MRRRGFLYPAGVLAVLVVLAAAAWALRSADGDPPPAGPSPTAAVALSPTPASSPNALPTPTVPPLVPFPDNAVIHVAHSGYAHGSGVLFSFTRHYRDARGELRTDELLKWTNTENSAITGVVANERGELFASTCYGPQCGSEGPGNSAFETAFTRSTDGGLTWREIGRKPGRWWARLALDDGVIGLNFDGQQTAYVQLPSGETIGPPTSLGPVNFQPIVFRGQLAWVAGTRILNGAGERLYDLELPGYPNLRVQDILALRRGGPSPTGDGFPLIYVSWSADGLPGLTQFFVGSFLPPIGTPLKVLQVENGVPRLAGFLNERDLLVTQDYVRPGTCTAEGKTAGADPAIIPFDLRSLSFIGTPFYDEACSQGAQLVVSTQFVAIWAMVKGDGDCVNLRQEPSLAAPALDCLGDGAIVSTGKASSNDGTRFWQSVTGPSGQAGWMAAEFLD